MKHNKILVFSLATLLLVALVMTSVQGAVVVSFDANRTLTTNSVTSGIIALNFTITTGVTDGQNMTNCSLWGKSNALTANTTYIIINGTDGLAWISNDTEADTNFTLTFDTSMFEDANDYKFKAICNNDTTTHLVNISSAEITGVTIDNTVPTAPTSLSPATDSVSTTGTVNFSCTTVDVASTTSCTIKIGADTYTGAYTEPSCSYQLTAMPTETYDWYCTASDESNTTRSDPNRANIKLPSSGDSIIALSDKADTKKPALLTIDAGDGTTIFGMPQWFAITLVLIAVAIGASVYFSKRR